MNFKILFVILFISLIWYIFTSLHVNINRGGVALLSDTNTTLSVEDNSTTHHIKTSKNKNFNDIFTIAHEKIVENIAQRKELELLDREVENIIAQSDNIVEQNHLLVQQQSKEEESTEMDSLLLQLEEVADDY